MNQQLWWWWWWWWCVAGRRLKLFWRTLIRLWIWSPAPGQNHTPVTHRPHYNTVCVCNRSEPSVTLNVVCVSAFRGSSSIRRSTPSKPVSSVCVCLVCVMSCVFTRLVFCVSGILKVFTWRRWRQRRYKHTLVSVHYHHHHQALTVCVCVCVCVRRRRSHGERGSVYSDTLIHWRIVSALSSKLFSNAIASFKRCNLSLKRARVTQTHSKQDLETLTHLKWELAT